MRPKVLIRAPNHLGDCIMALPMINETREAYHGSSVTVLAPEHLISLFENNPAIDETLAIPSQYVHGLIGVVKIKEMISGRQFDIGYVLPPSFGAASAFKLVGIKERIGYIADGRRLLLTRPLPLPTPLNSEHRSHVYFSLLRRATGADLEYREPKVVLNDADIQQADNLLSGFGFGASDKFVVIAFRAVAESRRWGKDRYAQLATWLLKERKLKVALIGSEDDRRSGDEMLAKIDNDGIVNLAGKTGIRELAAILSRAELFIGNDSGPAHLAAAVEVSSVVLSGADDPAETSPISATKRLLYLDQLPCASCVKNKCPNKGEDFMACMTGISLEMVKKEVDYCLSADGVN